MTADRAVFRFAPSPNGELHLGHAYSALLNADLAGRSGGRLLLRIEDIDVTRCTPEFEAGIYSDLAWLGIEWERPVRRQSDHFGEYAVALDRLIREELVYPAFMSRGQIRSTIAEQGRGRDWPLDPDGVPHYPPLDRALSNSERRRRIDSGEPFAWRLDMARAVNAVGKELDWIEFGGDDGGAREGAVASVVSEDEANLPPPPPLAVPLPRKRGRINVEPAAAQILPCEAGEGDRRRRWRGHEISSDPAGRRWREHESSRPGNPAAREIAADPARWGDVILARKEIPTSYHLSVALDDALQGVTHVVRGRDLYEATSVQRLLQELLGLRPPVYHHHRLIMGPDERKLSKSFRDTGLGTLREQGRTPRDIRAMVGLDAASLLREPAARSNLA